MQQIDQLTINYAADCLISGEEVILSNLIHQSLTIFYFPLFGVTFNALIFQTQLPLQIIQFSFP
jgi:hypothetical protein